MRALRHGFCVIALLASGCTGEIGTPQGLIDPPGTIAPTDGAVPYDVVPVEEGIVTTVDVPGTPDVPVAPSDVPPVDRPVVPSGPPDPGRVTIHRLNRAEYNNTVRDLFGTTRRPADDFPIDDRGHGFDNIADVLSLSTVHVELYQSAAERLVAEALAQPVTAPERRQYEAEALMGSVGAASGSAWNLWSNGELTVSYTPPAAGRYRVTVRAWQTRAGTEDANMTFELDGVLLRAQRVPNLAASPGEFSAEFTVTRTTPVRISIGFTNDFYMPEMMQDRNLLVDWIRVEGPLGVMAMPNPQRARIMVCTPTAATEAACARDIISRFGRRAWRRPLSAAEVTALANFITVARTNGEGFEEGIGLALQAMMLSPHFLFRVELDAMPTSPVAHPLNDHELASRLSYLLWSSMPDATLDALADAGSLRDTATLRAQVERMLSDAKARAFTENFAGQWLYTRGIAEHDVDMARYPAYSAVLGTSFRAETEEFFNAFLREDRSMLEFLTADFTFADDRSARHYGITLPTGTGLRRTSLAGSRRGGLLTHGSFLTVTSHPDRTSPVRRGQWVLHQLLCEPPPPPPAMVEGLPMETMPTGSLRQRMERHRTNPTCAACHSLMDPIGFAFEHFDAVGSWRMTDSGFAIDTTGRLPGATTGFMGANDLAVQLSRDPRYPRCVTQQLFTYALGRGPEAYDQPVIDSITNEWSRAGMRLRDLVMRIVLSDSFRQRRGEPLMGGM